MLKIATTRTLVQLILLLMEFVNTLLFLAMIKTLVLEIPATLPPDANMFLLGAMTTTSVLLTLAVRPLDANTLLFPAMITTLVP